MTPYRGMVFDNRPVAPVFLDSSPVSDGVAQFATALIQAPMMKQQIQSQRGAAAVEQAFKKRQLAHQERMDQMTNLFRQQELDLQKQKMEKGKAPKIHWRQGYGETGLPEGAPVPYVMGPDGRLQEVPIGPEAVPGAEPPPVDTSVYPDGEFTWYNPADWWRWATSGDAAPAPAPASQAPPHGPTAGPPFTDAPPPAQSHGPSAAAVPPAQPGWMDQLLETVLPRRESYQPYLNFFSGGDQAAPAATAAPAAFRAPNGSDAAAIAAIPRAEQPSAMANNDPKPATRHRTWSAGSLEAAMQAPDSDDPMQAGEAQLAQGLAALRAAANAGDQRAMQAAKQAVAQLLSHPEMGPHLTAVYRGFRETGN